MAAIEEMLGSKTVKNREGEDVAVSSFTGRGKVVGLYFSAHWCPPCRQFTPVLADFYQKLKGVGKEFEIVFISSDRDQKSFQEYFNTMPWLTLDFSLRTEKDELCQKFSVRGIPTLVLLNGEGEIITKEGRNIVSEDPDGANFPWK
ncbi:hypothetical protein SNE40_019638 [Patella caerulea]|uniref:Nucleoredoxin n=1 Tax=Patella caerulea TaxID=87958 RepID=A0AAN8PJ36_PATCE